MIGWLVRLLLILASFITSLFVSKDALNFATLQMIVAVVLFTLLVTIIVFWPALKDFIRSNKANNNKNH
jgi:hypothetical protein